MYCKICHIDGIEQNVNLSILFIEYPHEVITFLLGFIKVMQHPSRIF